MTATPGLPARFAAWRILHDVRHGVPFDIALRRAIKDLEPDDRRLAHELAAGVFRQRSQLDAAITPAVEHGIMSVREDVLDVLRIGAFQLHHLDRVPDHAAVQTAVGVARRLGGKRVAGFVNAVLRRVAERADIVPTAPLPIEADLAIRFSHPEWLVTRWVARLGAAETERLLAANNERPALVIQPARQTRDQLEADLTRAGASFHRAPFDAGLAVDVSKPATLPGFREGAFQVQDPAQRMVARFFDPAPGMVIYDACAAPGGKTIALAQGARLVIAADRRRPRTRRLLENVERAGGDNIAVIEADVLHPPLTQVDAVVLDVPCLGTGTFARNPDARWRVTAEALAHLAVQAAAFLDSAARLVRPGGLLLFATCSLEPEENEEQIGRFLERDRRFRREPTPVVPPELLTRDGDLMLYPHRHGTDGAYAARLRKVAP